MMSDLFEMLGEVVGEMIFGVAGEVVSESRLEYRPLTCLGPGPEIHRITPSPFESSENIDEPKEPFCESNS